MRSPWEYSIHQVDYSRGRPILPLEKLLVLPGNDTVKIGLRREYGQIYAPVVIKKQCFKLKPTKTSSEFKFGVGSKTK
jgi:hypothetical protein